jgi:hypothetical protein
LRGRTHRVLRAAKAHVLLPEPRLHLLRHVVLLASGLRSRH